MLSHAHSAVRHSPSSPAQVCRRSHPDYLQLSLLAHRAKHACEPNLSMNTLTQVLECALPTTPGWQTWHAFHVLTLLSPLRGGRVTQSLKKLQPPSLSSTEACTVLLFKSWPVQPCCINTLFFLLLSPLSNRIPCVTLNMKEVLKSTISDNGF